MSIHCLKFILLPMVFLTINLSLFCQIEGESEVTTIIIKKPEMSESGNDDADKRDITDIAPPAIKVSFNK